MDVVTLLREMVGIDTVNAAISGHHEPEAALSAYLESQALALGFAIDLLPVPSSAPNLVISYERDSSLPWILFDSHLDTVSVDGMIIEPFAATVQDGRVWGRGTCDTKGSGAAMFSALAEYSRTPTGANNVLLLYSVDEESGMTGIRAFVDSDLFESHTIKAAVVGEPTGLLPVVAHNGVVRFSVATVGVAAHSADPARGVSAISTMAELILYLEREYIPLLAATNSLTGKAQCSINVIHGGSAINVIPDRCEIWIDRRIVPGESPVDVATELKQHLDTFKGNHTEAIVELEPSTESPPLTPGGSGTFIQSVREILRDHDRPDQEVGVRYGTHAGVLSNAGLRAVVLGPGEIDQAHTRDEWINVAELEAAVPIYRDIMGRG